MTEIKFKQVGDTGLYNLFINGCLCRPMIPIDEVMKIISEKETEDEDITQTRTV